MRFANKLSVLEGREECYQISDDDDVQWSNKDCKGWRLPTEAEWELTARGPAAAMPVTSAKNQQYAARFGQGFKYAGSNNLNEIAWYDGNSNSKTYPVSQKKPNGFGLYDMSGNVWEWCWDWMGDYSTENQSDPTGVSTGSIRVNRGGSWRNYPRGLRVSDRFGNGPSFRFYDLGFRLGPDWVSVSRRLRLFNIPP